MGTKCICCRETCESTACVGKDGCIGCLCSLAYCHFLLQLPPRIGSPKCICCGEIMFGLHRSGLPKSDNPDRDHDILLEGFSPLHCYCVGCSCKPSMAHCTQCLSKCCCCHFVCESALPTDNDGLLFSLCTCSQLYCQCRVPPKRENNPFCACCGLRLRKKESSHLGVPAQQEMS